MKETLKKVIMPLLRQYRDEFGIHALRELIAETRTDNPKDICVVRFGSPFSKGSIHKYVQGAKLIDEGILIVLGDTEVPVDATLCSVIGYIIGSDSFVMPAQSRMLQLQAKEVSSDV